MVDINFNPREVKVLYEYQYNSYGLPSTSAYLSTYLNTMQEEDFSFNSSYGRYRERRRFELSRDVPSEK